MKKHILILLLLLIVGLLASTTLCAAASTGTVYDLTEVSSFEDGGEYIIVLDGKAMTDGCKYDSGWGVTSADVSVAETMTLSDNIVWTAESSGDGFKLKSGRNRYLRCTGYDLDTRESYFGEYSIWQAASWAKGTTVYTDKTTALYHIAWDTLRNLFYGKIDSGSYPTVYKLEEHIHESCSVTVSCTSDSVTVNYSRCDSCGLWVTDEGMALSQLAPVSGGWRNSSISVNNSAVTMLLAAAYDDSGRMIECRALTVGESGFPLADLPEASRYQIFFLNDDHVPQLSSVVLQETI